MSYQILSLEADSESKVCGVTYVTVNTTAGKSSMLKSAYELRMHLQGLGLTEEQIKKTEDLAIALGHEMRDESLID